jgi:hypothetical protein
MYYTRYLFLKKRWQAQHDLNMRMKESKSFALPLGYGPIFYLGLGRIKGVEPSSVGATIRCVNRFAISAMLDASIIIPINYNL